MENGKRRKIIGIPILGKVKHGKNGKIRAHNIEHMAYFCRFY